MVHMVDIILTKHWCCVTQAIKDTAAGALAWSLTHDLIRYHEVLDKVTAGPCPDTWALDYSLVLSMISALIPCSGSSGDDILLCFG